jgi:hypothetical protein
MFEVVGLNVDLVEDYTLAHPNPIENPNSVRGLKPQTSNLKP